MFYYTTISQRYKELWATTLTSNHRSDMYSLWELNHTQSRDSSCNVALLLHCLSFSSQRFLPRQRLTTQLVGDKEVRGHLQLTGCWRLQKSIAYGFSKRNPFSTTKQLPASIFLFPPSQSYSVNISAHQFLAKVQPNWLRMRPKYKIYQLPALFRSFPIPKYAERANYNLKAFKLCTEKQNWKKTQYSQYSIIKVTLWV